MKYYNEIKDKLINNEIYKKVKDYSKNKSDLNTYFEVGRILSLAGKHYGEGIIRDYSIKLTKELGKKYDISSLNKMKKYYLLVEKMATVSPKLSYSHYVELLPIENVNQIEYYIKVSEDKNLSVRELRERIKSKEYERLPESTKNKLETHEETEVDDFIKNPIVIKNTNKYEIISEKVLQQIILEDISGFMKELGEGFIFIESEYKIKIGNEYYYLDFLLYNYIFKCFFVVELKVRELRHQDIGQIQVYMNYIDKNIRTASYNKTIGLIIVKKDNKFILEYSSDLRIKTREYELV